MYISCLGIYTSMFNTRSRIGIGCRWWMVLTCHDIKSFDSMRDKFVMSLTVDILVLLLLFFVSTMCFLFFGQQMQRKNGLLASNFYVITGVRRDYSCADMA